MEGVILAPRGSRAWPSEGSAWRDKRELAAGSSGCPAHGQERSGLGRDQAWSSLSWSCACTRAPLPPRPHWPLLSGGQPTTLPDACPPAPLRLKLRPADHGASGACPSFPAPSHVAGAHRVCWCPTRRPDPVCTCGDLPQRPLTGPAVGLLQSQRTARFLSSLGSLPTGTLGPDTHAHGPACGLVTPAP